MAGKKVKQINKNTVEAVRDPFENFRDIPKAIINQTVSESKQGAYNFVEQLLGIDHFKSEGDMTPGQEIDLSVKKEKKVEKRIEAGIDYVSEILHGERRITRNEQLEVNQKIEELLVELKKLAKSSKSLEVEFKQIVVEQRPVAAGKYHVNFFEWLLSVVSAARIKVEESSSWLSAISGKRSKKDYWGMAKKHGTSFSLSGERVVATQVG